MYKHLHGKKIQGAREPSREMSQKNQCLKTKVEIGSKAVVSKLIFLVFQLHNKALSPPKEHLQLKTGIHFLSFPNNIWLLLLLLC